MNYEKYKKTSDLYFKLLGELGVLSQSKYVFEIDNYPNFDLSDYDKGSMETYFFSYEVPFPSDTSFILDAEIVGEDIFDWDNLESLSKEHNVELIPNNSGQFLTKVLLLNENLQGWGTTLDDFELHGIEAPKVNNSKKTIVFDGGYKAIFSGMQPLDWHLYAICEVLGFKTDVTEQRFYLNLIAEGYSLMVRGDFLLSFFIFYSAFECYVNTKLDTAVSMSKCNKAELIGPVCFKVKSVFRKEQLGWAFPA